MTKTETAPTQVQANRGVLKKGKKKRSGDSKRVKPAGAGEYWKPQPLLSKSEWTAIRAGRELAGPLQFVAAHMN